MQLAPEHLVAGSQSQTRDLRLTFIVGPARSGTSLLYKALCLHPEVGYISNWMQRYPAHPALAVLNRIPRRAVSTRRRTWFTEDSNAYVYGEHRAAWRRMFPTPVEGGPLFARFGLCSPPDPSARCDPERLRAALSSVLRTGGGRTVVSKRIRNNTHLPLLAAAFPEARFVFMVRDGRAVAYSLSRVHWWPDSPVVWYGGTPRAWAAEGGDPWTLVGMNWVKEIDATEDGLAGVPADRVLQLRYEDLIREPVDTLRGVARFSGLPDQPGWTAELQRLRYPDRDAAWQRQLAPEVAARITDLQRPTLCRLGYLP